MTRIADTTTSTPIATTPSATMRPAAMLLEQTRDHLRALKLRGVLDALERQLEQPDTFDLSFEHRLGLLVEHEVLHRENRRLARLLHQAKLRIAACVEDIDYVHARGLERSKMASLVGLDWVRAGRNLCITGRTGCGKTWLACAFGTEACRRGLSTRYVRLPRLLEELRIAHGDGSWARLMGQLARIDLLILDDWGQQPLVAGQRQDLMEVIEERHGRRATLIASQLPVKSWHAFIGEATLSDAIMDRLLQGAHRLPLKGASMRRQDPDGTASASSVLTDGDRPE